MPGRKTDNSIVKDWRKDNQSIKKYSFLYSFLPHPEKKVRARLLSSKAVLAYSVVLVGVLIAFRLLPNYVPGILGYASDIYVNELLEYTNERRADIGLEPLNLNDTLSKAAHAKAQDMFVKNYWAHVSPDGVQPWDFIVNAGYDYSFAGENLAKNFSASEEVVDAWYESDSHRENLLSANYEDIGFAVINGVLDGYETTLVVQTFGKSRTPTYLGSASVAPNVAVSDASAPPTVDIFAPESTSPEPVFSAELEQPLLAATEEFPGAVTEPVVDVTSASRIINIFFGVFLGSLLLLDIWYSKSRGLRRLTGHTMAHLLFLIFAFVGMWLALSPGKIL